MLNEYLFHQNGGAISFQIIVNALFRAFTFLFFSYYCKVQFHINLSFQCEERIGGQIRGKCALPIYDAASKLCRFLCGRASDYLPELEGGAMGRSHG